MNKFIYFEIPFTAQIKKSSNVIVPNYCLPSKDWLQHNNVQINKNTSIFTVIRNPYERVILQYLHQQKYRPAIRQYPLSFKKWCQLSFTENLVDKFMQNNPKEFLPQKQWIEDIKDNISIYKTNELNRNTIKGASIKTKKVNIEAYYDSEIFMLINQWYNEDFETFKWTKRS